MRLLIIAPNAMLVSLLTKVLDEEEDIEVVGAISSLDQARDYRETAEIVAYHADVAGPALFDGIRCIREAVPDARLVLLHAPDLQEIILGAIEVGAVGYVHSHQSVSHMLTTLRTVHSQGVSIEPEFTAALVSRMAQLSAQVRTRAEVHFNEQARLTERQLEVLALVHEGLSNEAISENLYISVGTVKNHVHNILKELNADNREQAAYWYSMHRTVGESAPGNGVALKSATLASGPAGQPATREAISEQLARFCKQLGWSIGHTFLLNTEDHLLVPTGVWYLDHPERYAAFVHDTESRSFAPQEDVIGNILFSPEPVWVADVGSYPAYQRAEAARDVGIESGLILPLEDGDLIGVMEFYAIVRDQPDPQIVADILVSSRKLGERSGETQESLDSETDA